MLIVMQAEEARWHGEDMLDALEIQRDHLNELAREGHLKSGSTPAMEAGDVTVMATGARVIDKPTTTGCAKLSNSLKALNLPL